MKLLVALLPSLLVLLVATSSAAQTPDSSGKLFSAGVAALARGAWDEAVDDFELLADRGFVHPDASFDRAVAYVERARSPRARPGDLGHAAAALAETLELRPDDPVAERALARVREEIARRRASEGNRSVATTPSLSRAVVGLLGEDAWSIGAAIGSLLLAAGLAARRIGSAPQLRLGGAISASIGAVLLLGCGGLAASARHFRLTSRPAVVVATEARLLDTQGRPITRPRGGDPTEIPEGASVHVLERQGALARVEWGTVSGWVAADRLRLLARP